MHLQVKDIRNDQQLRSDGLTEDDIKDFRRAQSSYYEKLVELDDANEAKDFTRVVALEYEVARIDFRLRYQGRNPKEIPLDVLKAHFVTFEHHDGAIQQYRRKVSNPATAVRAFCMTCMGGQQSEIRNCHATNCPLWPVRMGKNPFYGNVMPPVHTTVELEDDADAALAEDDDNVEAKD